ICCARLCRAVFIPGFFDLPPPWRGLAEATTLSTSFVVTSSGPLIETERCPDAQLSVIENVCKWAISDFSLGGCASWVVVGLPGGWLSQVLPVEELHLEHTTKEVCIGSTQADAEGVCFMGRAMAGNEGGRRSSTDAH
ncbi:hypothetical protein EJB05_11821, partial [Eragrostis curvula]